MIRIAIGCDHRGSKVAKEIVQGVLFNEQCVAEDDTSASHASAESEENEAPDVAWIGAALFTCKTDGNRNIVVGVKRECIDIPDIKPVVRQTSENGKNGILPVFRVDYPDVAAEVASRVSRGQADLGILICGTGIGMCVVANKFKGIRAASCHSELTAELSRRHNNANILCLPGELLSPASAASIVRKFLSTPYDGGRHEIRIQKIAKIEEETGL